PPPPPSSAPTTTAPASTDVATPPPAPTPAPPPPSLTEGTPSPDPTLPTPTVRIVSPTKDQVLKSDKAADTEVKLDLKNWQTATGSSHVHLILDNRPYKPIYDPKKPVKLSDLLGGSALDDGEHVLVAFPSRANHESVKTKGAFFATDFWVGKKAATPTLDLKKPLLVYSRPKGEYKGDMANHVLVDFQLLNETLAEGKDHVAITVTGPGISDKLTANVTKFGTPYYLDNLQDGDYVVKLDLLDKDGNPIAGPWNSTTRKITINHEAQADAMPGMAMPGASAAPASSAAPTK
ncbi:MAG: hypothetical protein ACLQBL_21885, partial [Polyangiaceae bacterium]